MANHPAAALVLRPGDREVRSSWVRSSSMRAGWSGGLGSCWRLPRGESNTGIAERLPVSRPTVIGWRRRHQERGVAGLHDEPSSRPPRRVDRGRALAATLKPPPKSLGVTHWPSRLLARRLGVSATAVLDVWREHWVQPWRSGTFTFSTDPELEAKVVDVVGLYLAPPENAVVLCVDEWGRTGVR